MADLTPNPELLRSLGRLARGLSCLFWGLPLTLLVSVPSAQAHWFGRMGALPPVLATGLLLFGTWQLGFFQTQERVWMAAHNRAQLMALVNLGLSPFLFWFNQAPQVPYFQYAALAFHLGALVYLVLLNNMLERLGAMLPDQTLRAETSLFASVNRWLIFVLILLAVPVLMGVRLPISVARYPILSIVAQYPLWFVLPFVLIALALTMALLWKTKEVILHSVFGGEH